MKPLYTAILEKEKDMYVANCPEFDIASQGNTIEEAKANLREAVELFLETATQDEIKRRYKPEILISKFEVNFG
ncbi:MAG: type II toxin-antitoxin system HicB family antitoxin [Ignavibacteriae bacterium]|nr:type II toxin-antitoxin system HicB family antitoxin [Ignavibacteriota bacterium]